jgi:hypothetical protein
MGTLSQTVREGLKILEKKAEEKAGIILGVKRITHWKGRKLVSITRWESMKKKRDYQHELLRFMPDGFVANPFHFGNHGMASKRESWEKDYAVFHNHYFYYIYVWHQLIFSFVPS